jgi:hypothetical protein
MDYARWLDEHQRLINDLRSAVNSHMGDNDSFSFHTITQQLKKKKKTFRNIATKIRPFTIKLRKV